MRTPQGSPAYKIDKIMLLYIWAKHLAEKQPTDNDSNNSMIIAGIGNPTFPIHRFLPEFITEYWKEHGDEPIGYGHPQGDSDQRQTMAEAMSSWYTVPITKDQILFTVGGAGGLHSVFNALKELYIKTPNFRVITPFPYYTLYADNNLNLHPIHVMDLPGYCLTADALEKSILSATHDALIDGGAPKAVLICNPNNPIGSVLDSVELVKIAEVLRKYPDLIIILDEAYAELVLCEESTLSLLSVAPDLSKRMIVMRSATKGLSAAGERMAFSIVFDEDLVAKLVDQNIRTYGHAPRSHQAAYAATMAKLSAEDRKTMSNYYSEKVHYVSMRLKQMGAYMPDEAYTVKGTFYILADFSDLLGDKLSSETYHALQRSGVIESDEDISYSLLFDDGVMVSPGSYYGLDKKKGYLRITCSSQDNVLCQLMDRLENRLYHARLRTAQKLEDKIEYYWNTKIKQHGVIQYPQWINRSYKLTPSSTLTVLELKKRIIDEKADLAAVKICYNHLTDPDNSKAAIKVQKTVRSFLAKKSLKTLKDQHNATWSDFVEQIAEPGSPLYQSLKLMNINDRSKFEPWRAHLAKQNSAFVINAFSDLFQSSGSSVLVLLTMGLSLGFYSLGQYSYSFGSVLTGSSLYALAKRWGFFSLENMKSVPPKNNIDSNSTPTLTCV